MKRAGKRTVRPERVAFGGSVRVLSGFAGTLLDWRTAKLGRRATGLGWWAAGVVLSPFQQVGGLNL